MFVCREGEHLPAMLALLAEPRSELASLLAGLLYSLVALGCTDFNHVSLLTGSRPALLCSIVCHALSAALTGILCRCVASRPVLHHTLLLFNGALVCHAVACSSCLPRLQPCTCM